MEKILTFDDVENIIKEKGDCGIQDEKLRKIIDFFNYNIENKNFITIFNFVYNIFVELFRVKMENILLHKQLENLTKTNKNIVVYTNDNV